MADQTKTTWIENMQPTIDRCELAVSLNQSVIFNPEGTRALGAVLKLMATLLDEHGISPPVDETDRG
jgi:hypothetical protein